MSTEREVCTLCLDMQDSTPFTDIGELRGISREFYNKFTGKLPGKN